MLKYKVTGNFVFFPWPTSLKSDSRNVLENKDDNMNKGKYNNFVVRIIDLFFNMYDSHGLQDQDDNKFNIFN